MNTIYISKPHFSDLPSDNLHYLDILTYVAIKSFKNSRDGFCFPSYETIADIMGASKGFVMASVNRLMKSEYLDVQKFSRGSHKSNHYYFAKFDLNDRVPYEILNLDLSIHEKAMMLVLRQFCVGLPTSIYSDFKEIAETMGLSYKAVYTQVVSLIAKGVIEKKGEGKWSYLSFTSVMDWYYKYDRPDPKIKSLSAKEGFLMIT